MAAHNKSAAKPTGETVQKPAYRWRRIIASIRAGVTTHWLRYRAALFQTYLIGAVIIFLILAVAAKTVAYFTFDVTITRAVQTVNAGWFSALMRTLSWIGFAPQSWIISIAVLLFLFVSGLKWETIVAVGSIVGSSILTIGLKLFVERPRPSADLISVISKLSDYSFPSGHVLYFTAFFGFLLFLAYILLKASWWRTLLMLILGGMIGLIGVSRIFEGAHWASDVIAAYLVGSIWLSLSIPVYRWGKSRFFVNQPAAKEVHVSDK